MTNARTGELEGEIKGEEEENRRKRSKDKKITEEERRLLERVEELGWIWKRRRR